MVNIEGKKNLIDTNSTVGFYSPNPSIPILLRSIHFLVQNLPRSTNKTFLSSKQSFSIICQTFIQHLLCARHYAICFTNINSFNPSQFYLLSEVQHPQIIRISQKPYIIYSIRNLPNKETPKWSRIQEQIKLLGKNVSRASHPLSYSFIRNNLRPNYPVKANICKQIMLQSAIA